MLHKRYKLNLYQIIAITYFIIILVGAFTLSLPISNKNNSYGSLVTSLFTSTSAICVTGLSIVDIWSTYTFFGQSIILLLMEIGGLGFMSFVSVLIHITRNHDNIHTLLLTAESLGSDSLLKSISRIQKRLLFGSIMFESIGAIILYFCFLPYLSWNQALWFGLFHSVSAFCNAGFDLMGVFSNGYSLISFQHNPIVLIVIAVLITVGGIGFVVWDDIISSKKIRNWSIYTRLVVITSMSLIIISSILFMAFEYSNADSIGNMNLIDKIANSIFQSVTPRTAGFASLDQANLTEASVSLTSVLMFIGGSTGSTAGGIKTVTFVILLCSMFSYSFGKKNLTIFKRSISQDQIINAYTIAFYFLGLSLVGGIIINLTSKLPLTSCLFESISALATVGLSLGITSSLSVISKLVLIAYMYIGRIGLLTLTMGFFKIKDNNFIKYPSVDLLIG